MPSPITCRISELSYRYGVQWLFRNLDAVFRSGEINLISGANGAGKSTLLRLIAGALEAEKGSIILEKNGSVMEEDDRWKQIALVAPYQELPEEFSLSELIDIQDRFLPGDESQKKYREGLATLFGLKGVLHKAIRDYSTGMKQKARLVLAFADNRPVCLLDEPGSNLDVASCQVLHDFLRSEAGKKLVILASNDPAEIALASAVLKLS